MEFNFINNLLVNTLITYEILFTVLLKYDQCLQHFLFMITLAPDSTFFVGAVLACEKQPVFLQPDYLALLMQL